MRFTMMAPALGYMYWEPKTWHAVCSVQQTPRYSGDPEPSAAIFGSRDARLWVAEVSRAMGFTTRLTVSVQFNWAYPQLGLTKHRYSSSITWRRYLHGVPAGEDLTYILGASVYTTRPYVVYTEITPFLFCFCCCTLCFWHEVSCGVGQLSASPKISHHEQILG